MRSPDNFTGYFRDLEANRYAWDEDGWFKMGDIAKFDPVGNLTIIGRKGASITGEELNAVLMKRNVAYHGLIEGLDIVSEFPIIGNKVDKKLLVKDINQKFSKVIQ